MENKEVKIVILQRGWVVVGHITKNDEYYILTDCYNIRTWGTTKGLGELRNGPLSTTVLDYLGTISFHELTAITFIDCESSWYDELNLRKMIS